MTSGDVVLQWTSASLPCSDAGESLWFGARSWEEQFFCYALICFDVKLLLSCSTQLCLACFLSIRRPLPAIRSVISRVENASLSFTECLKGGWNLEFEIHNTGLTSVVRAVISYFAFSVSHKTCKFFFRCVVSD